MAQSFLDKHPVAGFAGILVLLPVAVVALPLVVAPLLFGGLLVQTAKEIISGESTSSLEDVPPSSMEH